MIRHYTLLLTLSMFCGVPLATAELARIKDLSSVQGQRPNQLLGFGLVVGLANTGDTRKSVTTNKAVANLLTQLGMNVDAEAVVTQSSAAVIVIAELPAFAKSGERLDVKVSVIGDAKSLAGGTLLQTPLKAGDGEVYGVAQGALVLGRNTATSTVAAVPRGALIEREIDTSFAESQHLTLLLKVPDFTTASRIAERINQHLKGFFADALDAAAVRVEVPGQFRQKVVEFLATIEVLTVEADQPAIVVINERTGTIVMGAQVTISEVVVAHGDLTVTVGQGPKAKKAAIATLQGATVGDLAKSLNALGAKPADLVGIIQAIHASGGLKAELKIL